MHSDIDFLSIWKTGISLPAMQISMKRMILFGCTNLAIQTHTYSIFLNVFVGQALNNLQSYWLIPLALLLSPTPTPPPFCLPLFSTPHPQCP